MASGTPTGKLPRRLPPHLPAPRPPAQPPFAPFPLCRNLKIGYFSQHHVEQLDLNVSAVELLARKFPGVDTAA